VGGRIVWTLGNHDLYLDREGGQGGREFPRLPLVAPNPGVGNPPRATSRTQRPGGILRTRKGVRAWRDPAEHRRARHA
jgi:hypothetical protein